MNAHDDTVLGLSHSQIYLAQDEDRPGEYYYAGLAGADIAGSGGFEFGFIVQGAARPNFPSVPVPAAVWLFGTALIGLVGFGKRRKGLQP